VKEKLTKLKQDQLNNLKVSPSPKPELVEFFNLRYFTKLRICINQNKIRKRHEWHILMFGPDDVDHLMENEGFLTDDIEKLRLFYNIHIKDKGLDSVLTTIEQTISEH